MTENNTHPKTSTRSREPVSDNTVAIIAIVGLVIVMLSCICSCTLIGYAFFSNPPWF